MAGNTGSLAVSPSPSTSPNNWGLNANVSFASIVNTPITASNPVNTQDVATKSYVDLGAQLPANDLRYSIQLSGSSGSNVFLGTKTYLDGKPFTFGTWVEFYNYALNDDSAIWGYGYSSGNDKGYVVRVDGSTKKLVFFWGSSSNQAIANNTYCYGKMWLVLRFDGVNTLEVIINNVLKDTLTIAPRAADSVIGSYLGTRDGAARNLSGALDDSFLYNRKLTNDELTQIFWNQTFSTSGLQFLYHFDERTGTVAVDSSGNGNNGVINSGTYTVSQFGNPNRLSPVPTTWQAAASQANTTHYSALFLGSSTTAGADASTNDNRYTDVLGSLLHKQFNASGVTGGKHIRAGDTGWTTTGTAVLDGYGFGLHSYSLSAGATASYTLTNCTGFDLLFVQGPGQGTFTYQIDGGSPVTVTPNTGGVANRHDGIVTVTGLTLASHTVQINATNACIIEGFYVQNGDSTSGIRVYNSGLGSTTTNDFVTTQAASIWTRAAAIGDIAAVVMMFGSNDFSSSIDPATFKANLYIMIHSVWSNLTALKPDIILVNSYRRFDQVNFGTVYLYPQYAAQMQALAQELDGVYYVDVSSFFPLINDATHDPLDLMNTDNIHMNDAGHRYMARLLMRKLLPSVL